MRCVDADVNEIIRIENVKRQFLGEGIILTLEGQNDGGGQIVDLCNIKGEREGQRHGAAGLQGALLIGEIRCGLFEQLLAVAGVSDGLDRGVAGLAVEERGRQVQSFAGDGRGGLAFKGGDTQLQAVADPDGGGYGQIAVSLCDADVVIAVNGIQSAAQLTGSQRSGIVPGIGYLAGVDNDLNLGNGVGLVGVKDSDVDVQLFGNGLLGNDGAQGEVIQSITDFKVLVLGGIDAVGADGLIDALFSEVVGQDDIAGIIGVAPTALVVILVVGRSDFPALVQSAIILLVAGIVAACADLAFAVADFHQIHSASNYGIIVGEIDKGAEGRAGMVELADGVRALGTAQQLIVCLQAGVVGLVVQSIVVAGDNAGGAEGVDMAGAAGPGHFKAADGDELSRVLLIEGGNVVFVLFPLLLALCGGKGHVIQSALGVGAALAVEVVGVVGEGHKIHVGAFGQILDIVQRVSQRAGTVGVFAGMAVKLAEVELIFALTDGKAPAKLRLFAILTHHRDFDRDTAVFHILGRLIGELAVLIDRLDAYVIDGHLNHGVLARVDDLGRDEGTLFLVRLRIGGRGDVGDDGLILHVDGNAALDVNTLDVLAGDADLKRILPRKLGGRNRGGVDAILERGGYGFAVDQNGQIPLNAEDGIHGEGEGVILSHIGVIDRAEIDDGHVDNAFGDFDAFRDGIEIKGVDGVVSDVVHAVHFEGIGVVFQPLAMALVFCGAALHLKAAHAAGAGTHEPVGVIGGSLAVERVVAGAGGAEIAVGLVFEAVVFAVSLHGKDHRAVFRNGLAVLNHGERLGDCGAFRVVILCGQHGLGVLVVDDHLIVGLGQITGFAAGLHRRGNEADAEQILTAGGNRVVGGKGSLVLVPFDIGAAADVFHIVKTIGSLLDRPFVIDLVQRHAGLFLRHGELIAVCGGEIDCAVGVVFDRPDLGLRGLHGGVRVRDGHAHAAVIVAAVNAGQSLLIGGNVEDIVAVCDGTGDHGAGIVAAAGNVSLGNIIKLLLKVRTRALIGAPTVFIHIPLQAVFVRPSGVVDVEKGGFALNGSDLPVGVYIIQRRAGEARTHGQLLAVLGGEGIGAVAVDADGPELRLGEAGELAVRQRDIHTLVIVAAVLSGQSFHIGGVEDDHLIAAFQRAQIRHNAAFTGRGGIQLVQGEVAGVATGLITDSAVLVSPEFIAAAFVAGERHGIRAVAGKSDGAVRKSIAPAIASGLDAVSIAAFRGNRGAVYVGQRDGTVLEGQVPDIGRAVRDGNPIAGDGGLLGRDPCPVELSHGIAGADHKHIFAGCQLIGFCDFRVRGSLPAGQRGHRKHGNNHDQNQRQSKKPAVYTCLHKYTSFLFTAVGNIPQKRGGILPKGIVPYDSLMLFYHNPRAKGSEADEKEETQNVKKHGENLCIIYRIPTRNSHSLDFHFQTCYAVSV